MLDPDLIGRLRSGVASLYWRQGVAAAILILIAAELPSCPGARADGRGQPEQAARVQRNLQRQADLMGAIADGTVAEDGWTLSGAVPWSVTSNANVARTNPQSDSYLAPSVELGWQHTLRPSLVANVSLDYAETRYQRFTNLDSSGAELNGGLYWTMIDTRAYSSSIYSRFATYYSNNQYRRLNDIELWLSGGGNFLWRLSQGSSVYVNPACSILQAIPNRKSPDENDPSEEKQDPPKPQTGRSYMAAGVTIGGTIPVSDRWAVTASASQWVTRYAQYANQTAFTEYLSVSLSHTLSPYLSLDLNGLYTLNLSTVASEQYQDLTISITLSMSFTGGKSDRGRAMASTRGPSSRGQIAFFPEEQ